MPSDPKHGSSAAIYARFSSENQSDASIDDQVRVCRRYAGLQGFTVSAVYGDPAFSGTSTLRPDYQKLLEDARNGAFEIIVAESLDRLSRDLTDVASLYKHLTYFGIRLVTVAEGLINEWYLKDLAQKTHRGLEGRMRSGMSGGGICYG
jgi:site-specific DNA recombinase